MDTLMHTINKGRNGRIDRAILLRRSNKPHKSFSTKLMQGVVAVVPARKFAISVSDFTHTSILCKSSGKTNFKKTTCFSILINYRCEDHSFRLSLLMILYSRYILYRARFCCNLHKDSRPFLCVYLAQGIHSFFVNPIRTTVAVATSRHALYSGVLDSTKDSFCVPQDSLDLDLVSDLV